MCACVTNMKTLGAVVINTQLFLPDLVIIFFVELQKRCQKLLTKRSTLKQKRGKK